MKKSNYWLGVVYLAVAGCGYGIMAPLVRVANSVLPPFTSMFIRYVLVSLVLVLIIKHQQGLRQIIPHTKRDVILLVLVGVVGAGLSNVAFSLSVLTTTIGNAVFLFSLYSVFTPLLGGLLLREWPTRGQWFAIAAAVAGTSLLLAPRPGGSIFGNVLAILGALLASIQYVGTRAIRSYSATSISVYLALGTIVVALPVAATTEWWHSGLVLGPVTAIDRSAYPAWLGWITLLAYATTNLTVNLLVSQGFRQVRSSLGGILLLLEPVVGMLMGILFFAEVITPATALGATLVLLGGVVSVWIEAIRQTNNTRTTPSTDLEHSRE